MSDNQPLTVEDPDEVPLWVYNGRYGKIKVTAFNSFIGALEAGKWYSIHHLDNGSFWVLRLDEAVDERTAREQNATVAQESEFVVVGTQLFTCRSVVSPNQAIIHHSPTDITRTVLFTVEDELGPIEMTMVH